MTEGSSAMPPGWYYAQGDPAGTHRYWDGAQWQGQPQPVDAGIPGTTSRNGATGTEAALGKRLAAGIIDFIVVLAPSLLYAATVTPEPQVANEPAQLTTADVVFLVAAFAVFLTNVIILPGMTGQSIGKKVLGIELKNSETMTKPGVLKMLARVAFGVVFATLCYVLTLVDLVFILADSNNQRLRDKWLRLNVYEAN